MKKTTLLFIFSLFMGTAVFSQSNGQCYPTDTSLDREKLIEGRDDFLSKFQTNSNTVSFYREQLNTLYNKDTNTHVRMYFLLGVDQFPGIMPRLAMVTFPDSNCVIDNEPTALISSHYSDTGKFISTSSDTITNGISNWRNIYRNDSLQGYKIRHGYNFTWDTIFAACAADTNDLHINYTIFYDTAGVPAIHLVLSDRYKQDPDPKSSTRVYLDFAEPCPKLCGSLIGNKEEEE